MSADKTADAIKLNLRLPPALHRRLKQQARRNNTSLNAEIINQLGGAEAAVAERITAAIMADAERMRFLVANTVKMTLGIAIWTLEKLGHTISPEHYEKVLAAVWSYADKEIAASLPPGKPEQK
jgi:hypothetical protein